VVPRSYAHPHGKKITLAVSRVLHTTPDSDYQGVMLVNPGGPGGSGRIFSIFQTFVPNGAGESYDWIGFDPRGVGLSGPA
jgi:pimeloyl-ACP methyl ester carboxylesterase